MERALLALPLFLLVVLALILWSIVGMRGRWWLKLLMILLMPACTIPVWASLHSYLGWPTTDELPERFVLVAAEIREPNQKTGDQGGIYLWIYTSETVESATSSVLGYRFDKREPRGYRLPYDRELHEQLIKLQEKIRMGQTVTLGRGKKGGHEGQPGQGSGKGRSGNGRGQDGSKGDQGLDLYELPPAKPSEKSPRQ